MIIHVYVFFFGISLVSHGYPLSNQGLFPIFKYESSIPQVEGGKKSSFRMEAKLLPISFDPNECYPFFKK